MRDRPVRSDLLPVCDGKASTQCVPGISYRVLQEDRTPGYIFLEIEGKAVCVWEADFERVELEAKAAV
jgi:hypothetical protein